MDETEVQEAVLTRREKIGELADKAIFYTDDGGNYRMDITDKSEGWFFVTDEDTGDGKRVDFDDVKDTDIFTVGNKITVSQL